MGGAQSIEAPSVPAKEAEELATAAKELVDEYLPVYRKEWATAFKKKKANDSFEEVNAAARKVADKAAQMGKKQEKVVSKQEALRETLVAQIDENAGEKAAKIPGKFKTKAADKAIAQAVAKAVDEALLKESDRLFRAETESPEDAAARAVDPKKRGEPVVVCGPAGVGKSTLLKFLVEVQPKTFGFAVSHTTRAPRDYEVDGVDYHFVDDAAFDKLVADNKFLEHVAIEGPPAVRYGTTAEAFHRVAAEGRRALLDVNAAGAAALKKLDSADDGGNGKFAAQFVFLAPPSLDVLEARLKQRGVVDDALPGRMAEARKEMAVIAAADDGSTKTMFDAVIVNDNLDKAYADFCAAIGAATVLLPSEVALDNVRHILVPIKPSKLESRLAVNHALVFAKLLGCKLRLLAVCSEESDKLKEYVAGIQEDFGKRSNGGGGDDDGDKKEAEENIVEYVHRKGDVEKTIVEEAAKVEMVVMGTAGKEDFANAVLGSTAATVIQKSPVPVVTIRGRHLEAVAANTDYNKWLIVHDGSPCAKRAFMEKLLPLAKKLKAELCLLHVVEADWTEPKKQEMELQRASFILDQARNTAKIAGVLATTSVVSVSESVAHTILTAAEKGRFELIAMSTSGKKGAQKAFNDSVTSTIVTKARVPVLTFNQTN